MKKLLSIAMMWTTLAAMAVTVMATESSLSPYDKLKSSAQKICPVTGKPLGSMGDAVKVKIGEEHVFLCCQGCKKGKIQKEYWDTMHANLAKAQGKCPVMEKALPKNPRSTVVNGQKIYICCPPCVKKIQASPKEYLTKIAGYYHSALQTEKRQAKQATGDSTGEATSLDATPIEAGASSSVGSKKDVL